MRSSESENNFISYQKPKFWTSNPRFHLWNFTKDAQVWWIWMNSTKNSELNIPEKLKWEPIHLHFPRVLWCIVSRYTTIPQTFFTIITSMWRGYIKISYLQLCYAIFRTLIILTTRNYWEQKITTQKKIKSEKDVLINHRFNPSSRVKTVNEGFRIVISSLALLFFGGLEKLRTLLSKSVDTVPFTLSVRLR